MSRIEEGMERAWSELETRFLASEDDVATREAAGLPGAADRLGALTRAYAVKSG
jgi:hypothetical protein